MSLREKRIFRIYNKTIVVLKETFKGSISKLLMLLFLNSIIDILGIAFFLSVVSYTISPETSVFSKALSFVGILDHASPNLPLLYFLSLLVIAIRGGFYVFVQYYVNKFSLKVYGYFSENLYKLYLNKKLNFIQSNTSALLVRDVRVCTYYFSMFILTPIINIIIELMVLSLILVGIIYYDYKLFLLLVITLFPITYLFYVKIREKASSNTLKINQIEPELYSDVSAGLYGYVETKIYGKENYFLNEYSTRINNQISYLVKQTMYQVVPSKVIEFAAILGVIVMFFYGYYFSSDSIQIFTTMSIYFAAAYRILPSTNKILASVMLVNQYEFVFDVIEDVTKKHFVEKDNKTNMLSDFSFDSLNVSNVSFSFNNNEKVLKQLNLTIKKGEVIGIIGPSGSGKTTLIKIILGFYKPQEGGVYINDLPLHEDFLDLWRSRIGYVSQDVFIMNKSIKENIAFGTTINNIDNQKLNKVIKMASIEDVVNSLSDGVDTLLNENGSNLSGGQKQRIAIARALYHGADFFVFDEATSALDTNTEKIITESIESLKKQGMTVLIIAHRLSTLKYTDRIIKMENGEILAELNYDSLLSTMT